VEGDGDLTAVPNLIREAAAHYELFRLTTVGKPLRAGNIKSLLREGEFERFLRIATKKESEAIIVAVDADEACPVDIARQLVARAGAIEQEINRRVGVILFKPEFEVLFLHSIESIAERLPKYKINPRALGSREDFESLRDAKGRLRNACDGMNYKETRDQDKFIYGMDFNVVMEKSRCFARFVRVLHWVETEMSTLCPVNPGD